ALGPETRRLEGERPVRAERVQHAPPGGQPPQPVEDDRPLELVVGLEGLEARVPGALPVREADLREPPPWVGARDALDLLGAELHVELQGHPPASTVRV